MFAVNTKGSVKKLTPGERLKLAREAAGFGEAKDFAEQVGQKPGTYRAHEARGAPHKLRRKYADELGIPVTYLDGEGPDDLPPLQKRVTKSLDTRQNIGDAVRESSGKRDQGKENLTAGARSAEELRSQQLGLNTITVRGDLSAGTWRTATEWPPVEHFEYEMHVEPRWRGKAFGLRIVGRSMNKRWPDGTIVSCVSVYDYGFDLVSGEDYVVVYRQNALDLWEATAKRYEIHGDQLWLCPESDDDTFETIKIPITFDYDQPQSYGADQVIIAGVILGGYLPTKAGSR